MAKEYCHKLLAALLEMHQVSAELLGKLAVNHVDSGNEQDPMKALANVLKQQEANLKKLPSSLYASNCNIIYDTSSGGGNAVKDEIDIFSIDKTFQHAILFYLEGFPVSRPKNSFCYNCTLVLNWKKYCCDRCKECLNCNSIQVANKCPVYKLRIALEKDKVLRNLFSHITVEFLDKFLNKNETFPDLPNVQSWDELCNEFVETMTAICDYMCSPVNFQANSNVVILSVKEKQDKLDSLSLILNENMKAVCDINLLNNFQQILQEEQKKLICALADSNIKKLPLIIHFEKKSRCLKIFCIGRFIFSAKDFDVNGKLSKGLLSATRETLDELYQVKENNDYKITSITKLSCAPNVNNSTTSINFHIKIADYNNIFSGLSESLTKEAVQMAEKLAINIEKAFKNRKLIKKVYIHQVYMGSLNISGTVYGFSDLTEEHKDTLLQIMEDQGRKVSKCQNVKAEWIEEETQWESNTDEPNITVDLEILNEEFAEIAEKNKQEIRKAIKDKLDEKKWKKKLTRVKGKHNAAYVGEDVGENDDVFLCSEPETSGENHNKYIILVGEKEAKSNLVCKLTGQEISPIDEIGPSKVHKSYDRKFLLCDTPCCEIESEPFKNMLWVSSAINFKTFVSSIMIVVKDTNDTESMIEEVKKYTKFFVGMPDRIAACIMHKDLQRSDRKSVRTKQNIKKRFGVKTVVYASLESPTEELCSIFRHSVLAQEPLELKIDSQNFFKQFKLTSSEDDNTEVSKTIRKEVEKIEQMEKEYTDQVNDERAQSPICDHKLYLEKRFSRIAEFNKTIEEETIIAINRVIKNHNFKFSSDGILQEIGYLLKMIDQLFPTVNNARMMKQSFQNWDEMETISTTDFQLPESTEDSIELLPDNVRNAWSTYFDRSLSSLKTVAENLGAE